jgi:hypothetical protein
MRCPLIDSEPVDESTLRFLDSFITHIENVSREFRTQAGFLAGAADENSIAWSQQR